MRTLAISIFLIVASSVASADTALRPIVDLGTIDASCRALAHAPHNAPTRAWALDAQISVASCQIDARLRRLATTTTPATRDALEHAVRPSLARLDDVIAHGDLTHQIIAQRVKADIYQALAVRMASTVTPMYSTTNEVDHQKKALYADALAHPWRQRADHAKHEVARLAAQDPGLVERSPRLARAVADLDVSVAAR